MINKELIKDKLEKSSGHIIQWVGSVNSLVIHIILFVGAFSLKFFGVDLQEIVINTTLIVSYEAIFLSILIQMSVNRQTKSQSILMEKIDSVAEDMEDIQENVEDLQENVEDIQENIEDIQKDVEEINEDETEDEEDDDILSKIQETMNLLIKEVQDLKSQQKRIKK